MFAGILPPWDSTAVFGNAIVNAVYVGFTTTKNTVVKAFTCVVFLFRFHSVVEITFMARGTKVGCEMKT